MNTADQSIRQVIRNGFDGVSWLDGASAVTVSPDGNRVFVAAEGSQRITAYNRDALGNLSSVATTDVIDSRLLFGVIPQSTPVAAFTDLAFLSNGVLMAGGAGGYVTFATPLDASPFDGASILSTAYDGTAGGIGALLATPTNAAAYVAFPGSDSIGLAGPPSASITTLTSDPALGIDGASAMALSPDGQTLYVAGRDGNSIGVFARDAGFNTLTSIQVIRNDVDGVRGLLGPSDIVVSGNGRFVFVAARDGDAVLAFSRDTATGRLTFTQSLRNNAATGNLNDPVSIALDNTGRRLFVGTLSGSGPEGRLTTLAFDPDAPPPFRIRTDHGGIEDVGVRTSVGDDRITVLSTPNDPAGNGTPYQVLRIETGDGNDQLFLQALAPQTIVNLGRGNDEAALRAFTTNVTLTLDAGEGEDVVRLDRAAAGTSFSLNLGAGRDDLFVVGSGLHATSAVRADGQLPNGVPRADGDELFYDPQTSDLSLPLTVPTTLEFPSDGTDRTVRNRLGGTGTLTYRNFEGGAILSAPVVRLTAATISEGPPSSRSAPPARLPDRWPGTSTATAFSGTRSAPRPRSPGRSCAPSASTTTASTSSACWPRTRMGSPPAATRSSSCRTRRP
ncbi:MAG: lactonase family protein, partial [Vicinamibacterales bacterium]|nr:lactonase family protein [Vicinamibacterales bacterium]